MAQNGYTRTPLRRNEREMLRRLIDQARRARISWEADARCAGCGVEMVDADSEQRYLPGCRTCADRRAKHRQRKPMTSAGTCRDVATTLLTTELMSTDIDELMRRQRRRLAKARSEQLAVFAVDERPVIRSQDELDAIVDWSRPPIVVGDAELTLEDDHAGTEHLIEVRERACLAVEGIRARVLARDDAAVYADGVEIEVWGFDRAQLHAVGATVYALDQTIVAAQSAYASADADSTVDASGFADVTALGHARVAARDWSTVYACDEAAITIHETHNPTDIERAFLDSDRPYQMTLFVLGRGRVTVGADSAPCVLALHRDGVLDAEDASDGWWRETLARTEDWVAERAEVFGDPLARLRQARALVDEQRRRVEQAATWRPLITPRTRRPDFAE